MDDLTRARAKRIAQQRTTDEIRADIRAFQSACPVRGCGRPMRDHTDEQLTICAFLCTSQPEGA